MKDNQTIERCTMCLEEQVTTLTDALLATQEELRDIKSKVDTNMPLKPYHNLALEGLNRSILLAHYII